MYPGEGSIYLEPGFIDPHNHDYTLRFDSPLVEMGEGASVEGGGRCMDIGAMEFQWASDPAVEVKILITMHRYGPARIFSSL